MKVAIRKPDNATEFYTEEKCYITELSNSPDDEALSIARAWVAPGVTTCWHRLNTSGERYYILSGSGRVDIGPPISEEVAPGDVVIIPPKCSQRIIRTVR